MSFGDRESPETLLQWLGMVSQRSEGMGVARERNVAEGTAWAKVLRWGNT